MLRSVRVVLTSILLMPLLTMASVTLAATPAHAGICDPNTTIYRITERHPWLITHVARYGVAPQTSISTTWTATSQARIRAGIEVWGEYAVSADAVIAKAEVKAGVRLALEGEVTKTSTVSQQITFGATRSKRIYAFFRGVRRYHGHWKKSYCSANGLYEIPRGEGTWRSFRPAMYTQETTLCARGGEWISYPAGSLDRKACAKVR